MNEWFNKIGNLYQNLVWERDLHSLSGLQRILVPLLRLIHNMTAAVLEGPLTLRAMSLVYTTLLSLVPMLAVSFSVLKALGVHNEIEPLLNQALEPLGSQGRELTTYIIRFVNNMRVGVLGSVGLVFLVYTVVSLVQKVEEAFNFIWRIRETRRLIRRFSDYMSVILVGPVLVFAALGITAAVMNNAIVQSLVQYQPFATLIDAVTRLLPYVLVCIAFTFVYLFIPNTRVRFGSALAGGLLGGILWESGGWAFAAFVASSSRYTLIYSGFAIVIMFMIWLYVSWLIVLLGAQVAYYHQHPAMINVRRGHWRLGNREEEQAALGAMLLIGYHFYHQLPWCHGDALAARMNIPSFTLRPILESLRHHGLICESGGDPVRYFPARDIENITVLSILQAVRHSHVRPQMVESGMAPAEVIMKRVDEALEAALDKETLRELVVNQPPPAQPV